MSVCAWGEVGKIHLTVMASTLSRKCQRRGQGLDATTFRLGDARVLIGVEHRQKMLRARGQYTCGSCGPT